MNILSKSFNLSSFVKADVNIYKYYSIVRLNSNKLLSMNTLNFSFLRISHEIWTYFTKNFYCTVTDLLKVTNVLWMICKVFENDSEHLWWVQHGFDFKYVNPYKKDMY